MRKIGSGIQEDRASMSVWPRVWTVASSGCATGEWELQEPIAFGGGGAWGGSSVTAVYAALVTADYDPWVTRRREGIAVEVWTLPEVWLRKVGVEKADRNSSKKGRWDKGEAILLLWSFLIRCFQFGQKELREGEV